VILNWLGDYFRSHVLDAGRLPAFLMLCALSLTFITVRVITFGIRSGARWAPRNITPGGLHIHHVVPGLILLLLAGFIGLGLRPGGPSDEILAVLFGIGAALALDEFALVLHLEDVYWTEEGRGSVDAVILAVLFTGLMVVGLAPIGFSRSSGSVAGLILTALVVVNIGFVLVAALKGKLPLAIIGLFVPGVAMVAGIRLAHPGSPWARSRYADDPVKAAEAQRRYAALRWPAVKRRILDLFSGVPGQVRAGRRASRRHRAPPRRAPALSMGRDPVRLGAPAPPQARALRA
jgi:lysyl-tRNA synthetase class 2